MLDAVSVCAADKVDPNEENLIRQALVGVNLPKFISSDAPLFMTIVDELFGPTTTDQPLEKVQSVKEVGTEMGRAESDLRSACVSRCRALNLQPTEWFLSKVLQLKEVLLVRHGVMIIGEPMSAKSAALKVLAEALTQCEKNRTVYKVINPKSMTMAGLYGSFESGSDGSSGANEWSDGVLGRTFREMAADQSNGGSGQERRWIVFDGPVDPTWIENLNTVLDDSKKLCLMNGEIIPLAPWMNVIFEISDLQKASPAVVGR